MESDSFKQGPFVVAEAAASHSHKPQASIDFEPQDDLDWIPYLLSLSVSLHYTTLLCYEYCNIFFFRAGIYSDCNSQAASS